MTLNDLELHNSPNLAFFSPNSIALLANYVTVIEDGPIMSVKYCLPVSVFHFWPKPMHPTARSLCDSWPTCSDSVRLSVSKPTVSTLWHRVDRLIREAFVTQKTFRGWYVCGL